MMLVMINKIEVSTLILLAVKEVSVEFNCLFFFFLKMNVKNIDFCFSSSRKKLSISRQSKYEIVIICNNPKGLKIHYMTSS